MSKGDVPKVRRTTVATGILLLLLVGALLPPPLPVVLPKDVEGEMERGAYEELEGGLAFFRCIMVAW